jgi:hypothetical protein
MNDLKKYAGLLNDIAPKNHLLAYITPSERDMLVEAGGVKTPTPSGIFAYPPSNDARGQSTGSSSSSNNDGSGRDTGSDYGQFDRAVSQAANNPPSAPSGGDGGYVDRIQRISSGVEPGYTPTSSQPFGVSPEQAYNEGKITVDQYREAQQVQDNAALNQPNLIEKAFDLYKQYGIIPNALKLGGSLLDKIGGVSKSLQNKAIAFDLQNKLEKAYQSPTFDPFSPDASVTQLEQDLARAKAGEYSQQEYQDRYAPQMNQTDQGGSERDAMNALTPYAPYAISGQTPQDSMVNQYFANMNMNQGSPLSSDLQTSYNNAKNSVNSILGMTPTNQQFGYSAQPYGLLSSTNMADNPYNIPYLQQRGLI